MSETAEPKNIEKFEPKEQPASIADLPPHQISTRGREALNHLVQLLDCTPGVPRPRNTMGPVKGWMEDVIAIDQELVVGIANAKASGQLQVKEEQGAQG